MKINIDNFIQPTFAYNPKILHRLISGFNPDFNEFTTNVVDKKTINPPYPLILSAAGTNIRQKTNVYPSIIIGNEGEALANVIYATVDDRKIFSDGDTETDLGYPSGSAMTGFTTDLIIFNGKIVVSHYSDTSLRRGDISATPNWTSFGSLSQSLHKMKRFQNRIHVLNASAGAQQPNNEVKVVEEDWTVSTGINLGDFWDIKGIENYIDKYNLLFATIETSPRLVQSTTVFVWDGVIGNTHDYTINLEGAFRCSIVKNNIPYVFTRKNRKILCYSFNGFNFVKEGELQDIRVKEYTSINKSYIAVMGDYFVITAVLETSNSEGLLFWNIQTKNSFFIPITGLVAVYSGKDTSGIEKLYYSTYTNPTTGTLAKLEFDETSKIGTAQYKTNIIPIPPLKNDEKGKAQIKKITVEWNTKPPSSSDIISLTLTSRDDEDTETDSTFTATMKNTTANSTNAVIETKRGIIMPSGVNPLTQFEISLDITNATGSWDLIIRRIIVEYDNVAIKN